MQPATTELPTAPETPLTTDADSTINSNKNGEVKKKQPIVGLDLGSLKAVVAIHHPTSTDDNTSLPYIAHNNLSNDETPTIISFRGKERFIGETALSLLVSNPKNTVSQFKRLLGRSSADLEKLKSDVKGVSFNVVEHPEFKKLAVEVNYRNEQHKFTLEQLLAMMLTKFKDFVKHEIARKNKELETEDALDSQLEPQWVISVPGAFQPEQQIAVLNAAKIAGIEIIDLIPETTAAALTYGFLHSPKPTEELPDPKKTTLLIEIGHSYFSALVVEFKPSQLRVLASVFDDELGAKFIDQAVYDHCAKVFQDKTKLDVSSNPKAVNRLMKAAEKCKHVLSTLAEAEVGVDCLMNDIDLFTKLSRNVVEELVKDNLEKITTCITGVLTQAGVTADNLNTIEVIGGGIRSPIIQSRLKNILGRDIGFSLDSAHCIAMGSALYGKNKHPEYSFQYEVVDANMKQHQATITAEELEQAASKNNELIENDKHIEETHAKKNEIETYIYSKRSQCNEKSREDLVNSDEKDKILKILRDSEDWLTDLSDDDSNFEVLDTKLKEIMQLVNTAAPRLHEQLVKEEEERKKAASEAEEYLKTYKPEKKDREPRTKAEKLEAAKKKKHQGNICFKDGDYENATARYIQALVYLEQLFDLSPEQKKEVDEMKLPCYLNNAASFLKLQKYQRVIDNCAEALKIDSTNVKALFRRGQAYYYMKSFEESKKDLLLAAKLEPNNNDIKKTLKAAQDQLTAQTDREKKMYQKMFG